MNEDQSSDSSDSTGLIERIGQFISRDPKDRSELLDVLRDAQQRKLIDPDALGMIEGVLQVSEMQARDIMIPRSQMEVVKESDDLLGILAKVVPSAHSRIPVVKDSIDEVAGVLLAKDLLRYFNPTTEEEFDLNDILRPVKMIPESMRLNVLLREFRNNRSHLALVVDEYGGVSGLVTIEDVLEQIVGEIEDEHDVEDDEFNIMRHADGRFTVKALTELDEINEYFKTSLDNNDVDTIGGLVVRGFGHVPKRGETLELEPFNVRVLRADNRRVHLLELTFLHSDD